MKSIPDMLRREGATNRTIKKYRRKEFDWGKAATCAHLAFFHLRQMGHRTPTIPPFRSALGALRALRSGGFDDLPALLDSIRTVGRVAPAMMLMGDLAVLPGGCFAPETDGPDSGAVAAEREFARLGSVVVCMGPHKVIGWREDSPRMVVLDLDFAAISAAWRL